MTVIVVVLGGIAAFVVFLAGSEEPPGGDVRAPAGEASLLSVDGYVYADAEDAEVLAGVRKTVEVVNEYWRAEEPELGDFYPGWSAQDVLTPDGDYICTLVLTSVNPDFFDQGLMTREGLLIDMAGGMDAGGGSVSPEEFAGQTVYVATAPDSTVGYLFLYDDTVVMISSGQPGDQAGVREFVEAFVDATSTAGGQSESEGAADWTYVDELSVGDCVVWAEGQGADSSQVVMGQVVPCTVEHDDEVFAIFDLPHGDVPYPGDEAVATAAGDGCHREFAGYVGIGWEESQFDYRLITPTKALWEKTGDREVICVAVDPSGSPLTQSVRELGQ